MPRMGEYSRYCPVSMGSEVIADRWTPLIVRELVLGNTRFNDIARGLPGISRSLLVRRLGHLERAGVIERWPSPTGKGSEYLLTSAGRDLEKVLMALGPVVDRVAVHRAAAARHRRRDADVVDAPPRRPRASCRPGRVVAEFVHTASGPHARSGS